MGFPVPPAVPVLVIAQVPLARYTQAGPLPPVVPGQPFWVSSKLVNVMVQAGQAILAPEGTPEPPVEISLTVNGQPGFAAGVSNASY